MSWSPLSWVLQTDGKVTLSKSCSAHSSFVINRCSKPSPLSLPSPSSCPHCKQASLFLHRRKCFNFLSALTLSPFSNLALSSESKFMIISCASYSISSWFFRDLGSSEIPYFVCDLNFFPLLAVLHLAFFLQGIVCAQISSPFPMPPLHHGSPWTIS